MKRSEMVAIIENFIYELGVEPDETQEEADIILTALEEAGILPPINKNVAQGDDECIRSLRWEKE